MEREKWVKSFGIGLTGGIATGKSTVATLLRTMGVWVCDADILARQVVKPGGEALSQITQTFGDAFLLPSGELNRAKVREEILVETEKRKKLEMILHPAIQEQLWIELEKSGILGTATVWVYEAALLFETNTYKRFREIWVTLCSRENQLTRLCQRDNITMEQAVQLLQLQGNPKEQSQRATRIINTQEDLSSIREQLCKFLNAVK